MDDDGLLVHPLLTVAPRLALWRAPTDNDRVGGMAARWHDWGLAAPERRLLGVESDGARVVVRAEYRDRRGRRGATSRCSPRCTRRTVSSAGRGAAVVPDGLADVARVGTVFETVAGLDGLEWFGQRPVGDLSRPMRRRVRSAGSQWAWRTSFTPYLRPQESGGRHGVRRFALAGPAGDLAVHLG